MERNKTIDCLGKVHTMGVSILRYSLKEAIVKQHLLKMQDFQRFYLQTLLPISFLGISQ